nr:PDZ and LIM domain protein 5-like isoform X1 [Oncorhynchus nerka]
MNSNYSVSLGGPAPWGFRLQGGKDFCLPLTISRLTDGGKAAKAKMSVGDVVLSIDGIATNGMNHLEAQNKIKACTDNLNLTLQKASSVPKADTPKDEPLEIIKPVPITHPAPPFTSPSPQPGAAYNKTARPFGGGSNVGAVTSSLTAPKVASIPSASSAFTPAAPSSQQPQPPFPLASSSRSPAPPSSAPPPRPGSGRSPFTTPSSTPSSSSSSSPARVTAPSSNPGAPQSSCYNTPINLYSNANVCEVAIGQRRGLLEAQGVVVDQIKEQFNGVPPKTGPRRNRVEPELTHASPLSEASKKRLIEDTEDWHPRTGTSQSRSFRILAQITGTEKDQAQENSAGKKVNKPDPKVGQQYNKLRDRHHSVSAGTLNVQ